MERATVREALSGPIASLRTPFLEDGSAARHMPVLQQ